MDCRLIAARQRSGVRPSIYWVTPHRGRLLGAVCPQSLPVGWQLALRFLVNTVPWQRAGLAQPTSLFNKVTYSTSFPLYKLNYLYITCFIIEPRTIVEPRYSPSIAIIKHYYRNGTTTQRAINLQQRHTIPCDQGYPSHCAQQYKARV
jgi:hypothetical protein